MPVLVRLTSVWTGFQGAPGYTNIYALPGISDPQDVADDLADNLKDFWDAINTYIPDDVTVTISPTWSTIEQTNGLIQDEGTLAAPPGATVGLGGGNYAGNVGVAVDWHTGTFLNGHRLKGRSYLVPLAGAFGATGQLAAIPRQAIVDAAEALLASPTGMVVWHRPVNGAGGSSAQILSATVTDRAAVLRSRSI